MIAVAVDPFPGQDELDTLWRSAWGGTLPGYAASVLPRSLAHLAAHEDGRLVGFVNIAWDGGQHAFLLDICVHAGFRRRGIATRLVREAVDIARQRGAAWLHVDFEPRLEHFYRGCGFEPTAAG